MKFKKFSSIENSYQEKLVNKFTTFGHGKSDVEWVLLEKVHGSNFQAVASNSEIKWGKRTSFLTTTEEQKDFYRSNIVVDRYTSNIEMLYEHISRKYTDAVNVHVYGELYGGIYPEFECDKHVQKGIYYSPNIEFIAYDVCYTTLNNKTKKKKCDELFGVVQEIDESDTSANSDDDTTTSNDESTNSKTEYIYHYLDYDDVVDYCTAASIPVLKSLKTGTLNEMLDEDPDTFESEVYKLHGLPKIKNNIGEGFVIKPKKSAHMPNGSRVILKKKAAAFAEIIGSKHRIKIVKKSIPLSAETIDAIEIALAYITIPRIDSVASKMGEKEKQNRKKFAGLIVKDAIVDLIKNHPNLIDKKNKKAITGHMSATAEKELISY